MKRNQRDRGTEKEHIKIAGRQRSTERNRHTDGQRVRKLDSEREREREREREKRRYQGGRRREI